MKLTLYDLSESYLNVLNLLGEDDNEDNNQQIENILNQINEEIENKADNMAKLIKTIDANNRSIKEEKDRLSRRQLQGEAAIKRLKKYLEESMIKVNKTKFKTDLFSFNVQNFKKSVIIEDFKKVPETYLVQRAPDVDRQKLYQDLKNGLEIEGIHLQDNKGLVIR